MFAELAYNLSQTADIHIVKSIADYPSFNVQHLKQRREMDNCLITKTLKNIP